MKAFLYSCLWPPSVPWMNIRNPPWDGSSRKGKTLFEADSDSRTEEKRKLFWIPTSILDY